jgi:hypothetical protein
LSGDRLDAGGDGLRDGGSSTSNRRERGEGAESFVAIPLRVVAALMRSAVSETREDNTRARVRARPREVPPRAKQR